jgi:uncharacterized protein YdhG (YjbR/CyaY superfamily)
MSLEKLKPANIREYIDAAPAHAREQLLLMNATISSAAPGALEGMKWGMPAYSYEKILVTFAAFKKHIGFYPMETAMAAFTDQLKGYKTAAGSVQFPLDKPLPLDLIQAIVKFRVKESEAGTIKWRS